MLSDFADLIVQGNVSRGLLDETELLLLVREPFIRYGPKDQDVSKGEQVRLQCYVYGQPTPSVTWFKDGVALEENEAEGRAVEVDKSLVIQKARRNSKHDDSGVYYCYATNEVGSARSENAVINVKCK